MTIQNQLSAPYYAVIFSSILKQEEDGYDEMAQRMESVVQELHCQNMPSRRYLLMEFKNIKNSLEFRRVDEVSARGKGELRSRSFQSRRIDFESRFIAYRTIHLNCRTLPTLLLLHILKLYGAKFTIIGELCQKKSLTPDYSQFS